MCFIEAESYWVVERCDRRYAFVDGNYLVKDFELAMQAIYGNAGDLDFCHVREWLGKGKLFLYDALAEEPTHEQLTSEETRVRELAASRLARINKIKSYLDLAEKQDYVHVRRGTVRSEKDDSRNRQKEVDVMLAVDALLHASMRNISHATILTGDLDFRPVVKGLLQLGVVVDVVAFPDALPELVYSADRFLPLQYHHLYSFNSSSWQSKNPYVNSQRQVEDQTWPVVAFGRRGDQEVRVRQRGRYFEAFAGELNSQGQNPTLYCPDLECLKRMMNWRYSDLEWTPAS